MRSYKKKYKELVDKIEFDYQRAKRSYTHEIGSGENDEAIDELYSTMGTLRDLRYFVKTQ